MPQPELTLTAYEKAHLAFVMRVIVPWKTFWALLFKRFSGFGRAKTKGRVALSAMITAISYHLSVKQLRVINGTTEGQYSVFVKQAGLEETVEDLGIGEARLLWIGPRRLDKVILYLHGGAYLFPSPAPAYWRLIQLELEKKGVNVGIALLRYTFLPDEEFPYLLKEGVTAIHHLQKLGVDPSNIILVGESAGASFVHALLSHYLHPYPDSTLVPKLELTDNKPLGGAYLFSPWSKIGLSIGVPKGMFPYRHIEGPDVLTGATDKKFSTAVLAAVPPPAMPYVDAILATMGPDGKDWYKGLDTATSHILISFGTSEILRDAVRKQYENMSQHHPDIELYSQEWGIHVDPHFDMMLGELQVTDLTKRTVEWLEETFNTATG